MLKPHMCHVWMEDGLRSSFVLWVRSVSGSLLCYVGWSSAEARLTFAAQTYGNKGNKTNLENGVANCCLREAFESVCDQELNVVTG